MRSLKIEKNRLIKLAVILVFLFPAVAFSDTITLKSGKKIEGRILEQTEEYIRIEFNGAPLYYELKYIKSIEEDKTPPALAQEDLSLKGADFYLKKGLKHASQAEFSEAEQEFKKGLEANPSHHNLKEALKMIADLNNGIIDKKYAIYLFKGSDYLINAQYEQAITEFKQALKLKPSEADLYYYLGICHNSLEEYRDAITYLEKASELAPNDEIYYYLGVCHYSLAEFSQAITYLEKVLETSPDDAQVYSVIGTSYYLLGQSRQAKDNLYKARDLFQKQGDYLKAKDIEDFISNLN